MGIGTCGEAQPARRTVVKLMKLGVRARECVTTANPVLLWHTPKLGCAYRCPLCISNIIRPFYFRRRRFSILSHRCVASLISLASSLPIREIHLGLQFPKVVSTRPSSTLTNPTLTRSTTFAIPTHGTVRPQNNNFIPLGSSPSQKKKRIQHVLLLSLRRTHISQRCRGLRGYHDPVPPLRQHVCTSPQEPPILYRLFRGKSTLEKNPCSRPEPLRKLHAARPLFPNHLKKKKKKKPSANLQRRPH